MSNDADPHGTGRPPRRVRAVATRIREDFTEITGMAVERLAGLSWNDNRWRAEVDVVEVSRVPASTDVLATYEVTADVDGSVDAFERIRRFRRSESSNG